MEVKRSLGRMLRAVPVIAGMMLAMPASAETGSSPPDRRSTLLPSGYFSTKGNQLVDRKGRPVRLACVGWNQVNEKIGLATQTRLMAAHGFNCIRISWVNARMRQDLQKIDRIAAAAAEAGLRLVIDNHTNNPGHGERDNWGAQQRNGLWYDLGGASDGTDGGGNRGTTTDAKFQADWEAGAAAPIGISGRCISASATPFRRLTPTS
jgi:endoglucanase